MIYTLGYTPADDHFGPFQWLGDIDDHDKL